ncbi:MAG: rRNA maturation RNase YbeY [Gemmatimonadetes bacterium]|nr:rRNA maturation RNase YbeY [Gemmatimonadota bacterium]
MILWEYAEDVSVEIDSMDLIRVLDRLLDDNERAGSIGVILTDDGHIHRLNNAYRQIDRPTDVLSFELDDDTDPTDDLIGEVYISVETAGRQASKADRPLQVEIAHLAIHGTLHLLGFEHDSDTGYKKMRAQEDRYLGILAHNAIPSSREMSETPEGV